MSRSLLVSTAFLSFLACCHGAGWGQESKAQTDQAALSRPVKFTRDFRPILARQCIACHRPDVNQGKAKLRLDLRDGTTPFVPRSVDPSEAVQRIASQDATEQMPLGGKEKRLPPDQVRLLTQWVQQGQQLLV